MSQFSAADLIAKKRDGLSLTAAEIGWLVRGYTDGSVADYQMSAMAMAIYLNSMTPEETAALTLAMRDSGRRANLKRVRKPKADKHSTGGVGDKVSICLAPMVAACGVAVPMISGRGLGHTGGTLDKLEAIPGFRVNLPLSRFEALVERLNVCLIGQTADLAPADRKLYALRDVTGTVESIPLITASILSKKLAEDLDALVMDVKVGRGAFMKSEADARALARAIVRTGRAAGTPVSALLTRMDSPLGEAVGNALETAEALQILHGEGPEDVLECTLLLGAEMLRATKVAKRTAEGRRLLKRSIQDGSAAALMKKLIKAQAGDPRVVDEPDRLPAAPTVLRLKAPRSGYVADLDAMAVARVSMGLGAGRERSEQQIDPRVGVLCRRRPGDPVKQGDTLAELHATDPASARRARTGLLQAYRFSPRRPRLAALHIDTIRR